VRTQNLLGLVSFFFLKKKNLPNKGQLYSCVTVALTRTAISKGALLSSNEILSTKIIDFKISIKRHEPDFLTTLLMRTVKQSHQMSN